MNLFERRLKYHIAVVNALMADRKRVTQGLG